MLLALSSCARLEDILTRTLETIRDAETRRCHFKNCRQLMPKLAVDGFPLDQCRDLHLGIVVQTFEKARESIRATMSASGEFLAITDFGVCR